MPSVCRDENAMHEFEIVQADLGNPQHQAAIVAMMDAYSADPMGDARPMSEYARSHLIQGLREHPTTLVFLVFHRDQPCGIATCFRGFSTFAARPLLNISDFYIDPAFRGRGLGRRLLEAIQDQAESLGCCKLTLEVQQHNARARSIYSHFGFSQAVYPADAAEGGSLYLVKPLP